MTRTTVLKLEQVPAESKSTLAAFTKNIGFTPNMMAAFAQCVFRRIVTADFGIVTAHFGHRDRAFISAHRDRPFRDRDRPFRRS
jgi:hypothetical protein